MMQLNIFSSDQKNLSNTKKVDFMNHLTINITCEKKKMTTPGYSFNLKEVPR